MHDDLYRQPHRHYPDADNIRDICPTCAAKLKGEFTHMEPKQLLGAMVKREFVIPPGDADNPRYVSEHMWVHVTNVRPDGTLEGRLSNTPRHIRRLRLGAWVTCTLAQIEAVDYPH
jgi:uncharacterized protein YegJ (DUF2314 family)